MYSLVFEHSIPGLQQALMKWDPGAGWIVSYDEVAKKWNARTEEGKKLPTANSIEEAAFCWCRILGAKHNIPRPPLPVGVS